MPLPNNIAVSSHWQISQTWLVLSYPQHAVCACPREETDNNVSFPNQQLPKPKNTTIYVNVHLFSGNSLKSAD